MEVAIVELEVIIIIFATTVGLILFMKVGRLTVFHFHHFQNKCLSSMDIQFIILLCLCHHYCS
jgi:hypothetical protein